MAGHNQKGRSKGTGHFAQLHDWMMNSAAWRSLSPQARCVYVEVLRLYNGANNGFLALGVRTAAERANVNKDTAARCFAVLVERGCLEPAQLGKFNQNARRATEWRLTHHRCDRTHQLPSKAFARWTPPDLERRPNRGTQKSETRGQEARPSPVSVPRLRTISGGLAGG
jgi:hypothetical protein